MWSLKKAKNCSVNMSIRLSFPKKDVNQLACALFANCAIDEVDPVEEVDHVNSQPIVEILARGQFYRLDNWERTGSYIFSGKKTFSA